MEALDYVDTRQRGTAASAHPRRQPECRLRVRPRVVRLRPESAVRRGRSAGAHRRRGGGRRRQHRLRHGSRRGTTDRVAPASTSRSTIRATPTRAITVGSTHRDCPHTYGVSYFSSKGPTGDGRIKPDLVAPGERIVSCAAGRRADRARKPARTAARRVYVEDSPARAWRRRTCRARSPRSSPFARVHRAAGTREGALHGRRDRPRARPATSRAAGCSTSCAPSRPSETEGAAMADHRDSRGRARVHRGGDLADPDAGRRRSSHSSTTGRRPTCSCSPRLEQRHGPGTHLYRRLARRHSPGRRLAKAGPMPTGKIGVVRGALAEQSSSPEPDKIPGGAASFGDEASRPRGTGRTSSKVCSRPTCKRRCAASHTRSRTTSMHRRPSSRPRSAC